MCVFVGNKQLHSSIVTEKSQYQKRCTKNIGEIDKWSDNHIFLSWLPTQGTSQVVLAFVPGKMWSRARKIHKNQIESAYTLVYILDCVVYCTMVANFWEELSFCAGLAPSKSWTMSWKLRTACDTAGNIIAKQDRPTQKCRSIWSLDILHHLSISNRPIGQMGSIRGVVIHVKDLWSAPRGGFGSQAEGIGWNPPLMSILSLDVDCDFLPVAFYFFALPSRWFLYRSWRLHCCGARCLEECTEVRDCATCLRVKVGEPFMSVVLSITKG